MEQFLWKGRLRALELGSRCELRLEVSAGVSLATLVYLLMHIRTHQQGNYLLKSITQHHGHKSSRFSTVRGILCCGSRGKVEREHILEWGLRKEEMLLISRCVIKDRLCLEILVSVSQADHCKRSLCRPLPSGRQIRVQARQILQNLQNRPHHQGTIR